MNSEYKVDCRDCGVVFSSRNRGAAEDAAFDHATDRGHDVNVEIEGRVVCDYAPDGTRTNRF